MTEPVIHHLVHEKGLFGISADRPVTITVVDADRKTQEILPEVRVPVQEGLVLLLRGELVHLGASAVQWEASGS